VVEIYRFEAKHINEALKNNPDKFPGLYIIELSKVEKIELVKNFDRFNHLKLSAVIPKDY
jgi:hypothetical protein